jgi:hypothetical protein
MQSGKKSIIGILCLLICVVLISTVQAGKSVYVISNTNTSKLQAYKVDGNSLAYQAKLLDFADCFWYNT